ncbi:hypothetical protein [Streptomyces sp. NPDC058751]|uniref:hypothetical protein n=1 Tax=Streptomyces sp. NPDC058751 TaxID=3346623 RepID=UPI0036AAEE35
MRLVESERLVHFSKARDFFHARRVLRGVLVGIAASVVAVTGTSGIMGGEAYREAPAQATAQVSEGEGFGDPIWD